MDPVLRGILIFLWDLSVGTLWNSYSENQRKILCALGRSKTAVLKEAQSFPIAEAHPRMKQHHQSSANMEEGGETTGPPVVFLLHLRVEKMAQKYFWKSQLRDLGPLKTMEI